MKVFEDFEYTFEFVSIGRDSKRCEVTIHKYLGNKKKVIVPSAIEKISVTKLMNTFTGQAEIEYIDLPRYLKVINADTFRDCKSLKSITLPLSLDEICSNSFKNCVSLEKISLYNSILIYKNMKLGQNAFENCPNIHDKNGFFIMDAYLFSYNGKETNIEVPYGVIKICEYAFVGNKTVENVTIPSSVSKIGTSAFANCKKLREITISTSVAALSADIFAQCSSLEKVVFTQKTASAYNYTRVDRGTFSYSGQMRKFFLKTGEEIDLTVSKSFSANEQEQYMIDLLSKWAEISQETRDSFLTQWNKKIQNNTEIGKNILRNWVFYQQTAKEMKVYFEAGCHLELPEMEIYLDHCIKEGKTAETAILLEYKHEHFDETYLESEILRQEMLDFGLQPVNKEELSEKWAYYEENECVIITGYLGENASEILPDYVRGGMHILRMEKSKIGFPFLDQLFLPEGLEIIGAETFLKSSLIEVYIPSTVKEIGYMAFAESELRLFSFINTEILLSRSIFSGCKQLEKVDFTETITEIPYATFFLCVSLAEIILPIGLQKIGRKAFSACRSLKKIIFPNTLIIIDTFAFEECTVLEEIELPDSIGRLNSRAFLNCTALKKVILTTEAMCSNIHQKAFLGCTSLKFIGTEGGENLIENFQK